jgi:DNA-binding NarL/FixJ family response regulator
MIVANSSKTQQSLGSYRLDGTVTNHITNILAKLRVPDRTQAILRARDAGLA